MNLLRHVKEVWHSYSLAGAHVTSTHMHGRKYNINCPSISSEALLRKRVLALRPASQDAQR